jgi:hypothetical protein
MAAYASQYIVVDPADAIDERKSLRALRKHYDVHDAKPGDFAAFLAEMVRDRWSEWGFEERLAIYNEEQLHASEVQFLVQHGAPTPLAFKEKFGAEFVEHFIHNVPCEDEDPEGVAAFMLEFAERSEGRDWTDLNGYERFGVRILDMMHSTVEEFEEVAQNEVDEAEEKAIEAAEERKRAQPVTFTASAEDLWAISQLQMGDIEITLSQAQLKRLRAK